MDVVIASRIYLPEPSAASFYLSNVADELCRRGHDVRVLTVAPPAGLELPDRKETLHTFPVLRDSSGYVRGYIQYLSFDIPLFFRLLISKKPDVVLVEPPPTSGLIVRIVCRLRRIPYIYDAADIWSVAASHATSSSFVLNTLKRVEKWALTGAQHIVTISDSVRQRIRGWGIKKPISVVGRGADTEQFSYTPTVVRNEFIYAGSFSAWHGADILITAFAQFSETHSNYRLRFIGNGTERDELKSLAAELGVEDSVSFSEPISPELLALELSGATASLATLRPGSGYEFAFATKTYSSLASGCPVIFAGPGPTYDFFARQDTLAFLGEGVPYDADQIVSAMARIANRPADVFQRQSIAEWAQAHASMRASAQRTVDAIESVIDHG